MIPPIAPGPANDAFFDGDFFAGAVRPPVPFAFPAAFADLFVPFAGLLLFMTFYKHLGERE
jgi:hypothetical protein